MLKRVARCLPVAVTAVLVACSPVPYTGRRQFLLLPLGRELSLGTDSYREELGKVRESGDARLQGMVTKVSMDIAGVAKSDPEILKLNPGVAKFEWEVHLIDSPTINANCRPGGKMIVYTGILPLTQNEAGLATVMGHEVSHAVCRHGNERISHDMIAGIGMEAFNLALQKKDPAVREATLGALGAGVGYGIMLPFSRSHESEADHVGLILMAKAGYDPRESEKFWGRMAEMGKGKKPPEWASTHPSDETRIRQIRQWLPEALQYYKPGG